MDFLWPLSLVALAIVPLLVVAYAWSLRRRPHAAIRYSSLALIREARPSSSRIRRHLPFALFALAICSLVLALGRPAVVMAVPTNQTTIIITIDVSGSMCSTDIPPDRLQAAEAAAASFIQNQSASAQIGIVAFSGYAQVVQTPTNDQATLLTALHSLVTGKRTAIGSGILSSIDAISRVDKSVAPSQSDTTPGVEPAPVPKGAYAPDIIVLLTDGVNNFGPEPLDAAQQAVDRGVRVYTIGFGTSNGGAMEPVCTSQFLGSEPGGGGAFAGGQGPGGFGGGQGFPGGQGFGGAQGLANGFRRGIDDVTLQQVADLTGGTYHPAESAGELESVFQGLPTNLITNHEVVEVSVVFVALGGLLAAAALFLGRAWRPLPA